MHPIPSMKLSKPRRLSKPGLPIAVLTLAAINMAACMGAGGNGATSPTQMATKTATMTKTPAPTLTPTLTLEPTLTPTPAPYVMSIADVPDTFGVSYIDWANITTEMVLSDKELPVVTNTVTVNKERLMPVPIGLVTEGTFDSVDATIAMMRDKISYTYSLGATPDQSTIRVGVLSGIFIESHGQVGNYPRTVMIAFATHDGSWDLVTVSVSFNLVLVPVDAKMVSTDPVGQFYLLDPHIYIQRNRIEANPAIKPGDHILFLFYDWDDTVMTGPAVSQRRACSGLNPSPAIQMVIDGGTCIKQATGEEFWLSADGLGFMYLSAP